MGTILLPGGGLPIATRIESFYARALPIECDINIDRLVKSTNTRKSSRMHLVLVRPGRFHATFSTGEVLVVDAQLETISDPKTQQVHRRAVPVDHCPTALAYAAGQGRLARHLSLEGYDGAALNAPGMEVLVGTPRTPSPAASKVLFYATASGEVKRTLVVDPTGDRERYETIACTINASPGVVFGSIPSPTPTMGAHPVSLSMTMPLP